MAEIIFALDFKGLEEAETWVKKLKSEINIFKIGLQLFIRYGPQAVRMVQNKGAKVFLDLKIHDIPSICAKAVQSVAETNCFSTTIHIAAGEKALREAAGTKVNGSPEIWGVTVLSSSEAGNSLEAAETAASSSLDGVVVSGRDLALVKNRFGNLKCIVPGIRPSSYTLKDDQKRILTPAEAVKRGADYLVIGRPIRNSRDPLKTIKEIKEDVQRV